MLLACFLARAIVTTLMSMYTATVILHYTVGRRPGPGHAGQ